MVMAVNLFKLDSPESDIDMTTTKVAVQPLADRKFIKKKKKKHKHNRVSGGNEIVDVETSKHNEESQSHEKSLLNSDVDGAKTYTGKRRRVDCDIRKKSHKPKKKRKKQKGSRSNEIILEGSLKHESLQKELKRANMKLTSQAREIKVFHSLREGYEKLAAMKREPDRMRVEISIQNKKVSVDVSEFENMSQFLSQNNEIVKSQEEELEISIVVKRLEQQKTSKTKANLKKQTEEWLIAQDEANKLQEEAMKRLGEANETMENFRRMKKPLTDVRFEPDTLLSSREQKKGKELLLERQLEELEEQRGSMSSSYMQSLRDAHTEVERVKLRVTKIKNLDPSLDVQLRALEKKEKVITEMSYNHGEEAEDEEYKMVQRILREHEANGCKRSDLPTICQSLFYDNPYLRMALEDYRKECKVRTRFDTVFRWQPDRTERYKKTEICQTNPKLKNVCFLDLEYGLTVRVKDTSLNITAHEKEKHFRATEEDINHKTTLLENEKDQLSKLRLNDLTGQKLKLLAESDGLSEEKDKRENTGLCRSYRNGLRGSVNRDETCGLSSDGVHGKLKEAVLLYNIVDEKELRKEAESINCQTKTLSICFREERDNIQDERDALRNQQKWKLDNNGTGDLLNKMKRREVSAESLSRSETTRLQIFVKMVSGRKTTMIYANKNDSVEQLHHRIELKTKIPVKETCVIYRGEQDSSLHLLGRSDTMYAVSRTLRGDWFVAVNNINVILVTIFPKKRKKGTCEYLKFLLNSSVPAALVMLFASPLIINKSCAKSLINLCFDSCKDLSDNQKRCYSPVVLEVFRLLKRICSRNKLYVSCRNTLGSVLDLFLGIKTHKREMEYFIESKREEFEDSWKERKKKLEKECIQSLKESTKKELEHVQVELKRLDTERLKIKWREKEWAKLRDSVEELKVQRKKLERQRHMLRCRREDIRHENEELKNLENLKVALDDISTEVVKWEMAVRFEISNLEESGMENYSMIHIPMKYGVKRSKSELEKDSDAIRYMRNVGYRETRLKLYWCVRMIRRDMQRFEVFRRAAMKIRETYIGRGQRIDSDDGKSVANIFYYGERLIAWGSSKQETVVLPSCKAEDIAGTEAMEQAIWFQELHRHTPGSEQRSDIVMKAFGKLKFKEMRRLIRIQDVSEDEFKLKGENVGLSLK